MSWARRAMTVFLAGAVGCGGIPIVGGDRFVAEAGEAPIDLGRDANAVDAAEPTDAGTPDAAPLDAAELHDAVMIEVAAPGCLLCPRGSARVCCGDACRDLQTDKDNCGACGFVCSGTDECRAGECRPATCEGGAARCGEQCALLAVDRNHCGGCDVVCAVDRACAAGACVCSDGRAECGGACVNTALDGRHCGRCGNACAAGRSCVAGNCQASACFLRAETNCDGACFNLQTNPAHCGTCETTCAGAESCVTGFCTCPSGQERCFGACAALTTNENCGMCGRVCGAGDHCTMGRCTPICSASQTLCGGACTLVDSDPLNCGACGTRCASGQRCALSACMSPPDAGSSDAGSPDAGSPDAGSSDAGSPDAGSPDAGSPDAGSPDAGSPDAGSFYADVSDGGAPDESPCAGTLSYCAGSCVDTRGDPAHCGGCGRGCNAGQICSSSLCVVVPISDAGRTCMMGQLACSDRCVNTATDRLNCGACDQICPPGQACVGGGCLASDAGAL